MDGYLWLGHCVRSRFCGQFMYFNEDRYELEKREFQNGRPYCRAMPNFLSSL